MRTLTSRKAHDGYLRSIGINSIKPDNPLRLAAFKMEVALIASAQTLPDSADAPSITHSFLKHVLPDQGLYAAAVFPTRASGRAAMRHVWTNSLDELATEISRRGQSRGYGLSRLRSFQDRRRRQTNALGARAFWLDVDAGEEAQRKNPNAYKDAYEAFRQVESFCRTVGLPAPTYVGSGTGLHVYWPLVDTLDAATWRRYAQGLKTLCAKHGLVVGPERTADIASILRPPGTHHRKGEPKLVECGDLTGPYEIGQFEILLKATPRPKINRAPSTIIRLPAALQRSLSTELLQAVTLPISVRRLLALRDEQGCMPEPHWHACLGVLAYCRRR